MQIIAANLIICTHILYISTHTSKTHTHTLRVYNTYINHKLKNTKINKTTKQDAFSSVEIIICKFINITNSKKKSLPCTFSNQNKQTSKTKRNETSKNTYEISKRTNYDIKNKHKQPSFQNLNETAILEVDDLDLDKIELYYYQIILSNASYTIHDIYLIFQV